MGSPYGLRCPNTHSDNNPQPSVPPSSDGSRWEGSRALSQAALGSPTGSLKPQGASGSSCPGVTEGSRADRGRPRVGPERGRVQLRGTGVTNCPWGMDSELGGCLGNFTGTQPSPHWSHPVPGDAHLPSPRLRKRPRNSHSGVSLCSVTAFLALLDWDGSPVTQDPSLAGHGTRKAAGLGEQTFPHLHPRSHTRPSCPGGQLLADTNTLHSPPGLFGRQPGPQFLLLPWASFLHL